MTTDLDKTPLWVFLYLYEKSERECYIEYMRGAKALYKFISPIAFPDYSARELEKVPTGLQGYTSQELARAIYDISFKGQYVNTEILNGIQDTITLCYIKEVYPRLLEIKPL